MAKNSSLGLRNRSPKDEFYTQIADIEAELRHYRDQLRDKIVLCNCDDPYESNFFKYFAMNFNHLGLKKLIATCYDGSPIAGEQLSLLDLPGVPPGSERQAYKVEITEVPDANHDGAIDLLDVESLIKNDGNVLTLLDGDGDFRSPECIALLEESDVVVTNPPFSLFREYVAQLVAHDKLFIIVGSKNAITYTDIFAFIMENKMWLGHGFPNGNAFFRVPESYRDTFVDGVFNEETGLVKFRNVGWFTNFDTSKRHEVITLYKHYTPDEYPTYTNYPAIEVSKVAEIPIDYDGEMGVPITFLDRYNPEQFTIIGQSISLAEPMSKYARKEDYMTSEGRFVGGTGKFFTPRGNDKHQGVYQRVVIKRIGAAS